MSCVAPTVTLDLMKVSLSACCAIFGTQSENQAPLSPYCFQVRFDVEQLADAALRAGLDSLKEGLRHFLTVKFDEIRLVII